jgi:hypothetical protein
VRTEAARTKAELTKLGQSGSASVMAIAAGAGGVIAGLFSVGAAVGTVIHAYSRWGREMDAAGNRHSELTRGLVREIVAAGDAKQGGKIEAALSSIGGATLEQGTQAFAGVTGATPLSSLDRRLALAGEVAKQAPTGIDLGAFGGLVGAVADVKPGAKADDIADMAAMIQAKAGAGAERLGGEKFLRAVKSQVAAGKSPEQAFGFALAALDANVSPETITSAAEGSKPSKAAAFQLKRVTPEAIEARTQELVAAQTGDYAKGRLADIGGFGAGAGALTMQGTAQIEAAVGEREGLPSRIRARMRARAAEAGPITQMGVEAGIGSAFINRAMGTTGAAGFGSEAEALIAGGQNWGVLTAQDVKELRADLQANTQAIREANRQRGATNVNRHNEAAP